MGATARPAACVSCEVAAIAAGQQLRVAMRDKVVARLFDAIAGPSFRGSLREEGKLLDGRISVRCYANDKSAIKDQGEHALGAHVDGNVMTLLFADAPGLQVPDPSAPLTPEEVSATGIPSFGPVDDEVK